MTKPLTKAELLAKLQANPRFKEATTPSGVIIVGVQEKASSIAANIAKLPEQLRRSPQ